MATNSSTPGYLIPVTEPADDEALENLFQGSIVGVTGIPGDLVRPRWQLEPPNTPPVETDWCAFGVTMDEGDVFNYEEHDAEANQDVVERDVTLTCLISFYGPNARTLANRFRSGMNVSQNRSALLSQGVAFVSCGQVITVPALVQQKWVKRLDVSSSYRMRLKFRYAVETITAPPGINLDNEAYVTSITVPTPN